MPDPLREQELEAENARLRQERDDAVQMRDAIALAKAPASAEALGMAEMDAAVARAQVAALRQERNRWADEQDATEARVQRLREALTKFGHHRLGCSAFGAVVEWRDGDVALCNCGLTAALAETEARQE